MYGEPGHSTENESELSLRNQFEPEKFSKFMIYLLQLNLYLTGFYNGEVDGKWTQNSSLSMQKMVSERYKEDEVLNSKILRFQLENMSILDELEFFYIEDKKIKTFIYMPKLLIRKIEQLNDGFHVSFVQETDDNEGSPTLLFINSNDINHNLYHALTEHKWEGMISEYIRKTATEFEKITEFKTHKKDHILVKTFYYGAFSETFIIESNTNENIVFNLFKKTLTKNDFQSFNYDTAFLNLIDQYQSNYNAR